jgi:UDP-N-acetylglucosamine 2-epimerase (non-hydrolysing)
LTASEKRFRILHVVAARPNMMKVAPILAEMGKRPEVEPLLVHTGQHYDYSMSQVFFQQLHLPAADYNLEVGGGNHHYQTGEVIKKFGELVQTVRPDCIVVVGDVNATMACSLVAAKECVPLVHVESGLRSNDRAMPEEVNRIVADSLADLLLVTERSGEENLRREGIPASRIVFTGNVMIDSLCQILDEAKRSPILDRLGVKPQNYVLVTLHRPSNVDDPAQLKATMDALAKIASRLPVIFPVHPRTAKRMLDLGIKLSQVSGDMKVGASGIYALEPAPYIDFIALMNSASLVLTDSGGVQEETTYLGVPCLTYRNSTERPVTAEIGTNRMIGADPANLEGEVAQSLKAGRPAQHTIPPLWDGHAAPRIVDAILGFLRKR